MILENLNHAMTLLDMLMKIGVGLMSSEKIVATYLHENGFVVAVSNSENSNGIDVVAIKDAKYFTVEVKTACKASKSLNVKPIGKSGKVCDYIAIVTPNGNVIFNTMEEHLKLCSKKGTRGVTKLVRLIDG